MASAHLEARKELGKHFICSRLETHPTRPGNLALAPEWGLCMLPPPSRPGCGYWGGGGGQPHHVPGQASGATQPPSPWATPGPRLESFRLEKPTSPSSPPHLEATSQIQPAEGSQRNQAGPQLALDLQVSPVSGPHMSPGQAAASPTPQGHSLRHQGRHRRMCPYLSVCGSVAGPPVLPRGGVGRHRPLPQVITHSLSHTVSPSHLPSPSHTAATVSSSATLSHLEPHTELRCHTLSPQHCLSHPQPALSPTEIPPQPQ